MAFRKFASLELELPDDEPPSFVDELEPPFEVVFESDADVSLISDYSFLSILEVVNALTNFLASLTKLS